MISVKNAITGVNDFVSGTVELLAGFAALGVITEVIFGSGAFGMNVVGNLIGLVNNFGANGFAGLLALLILVGMYNKK